MIQEKINTLRLLSHAPSSDSRKARLQGLILSLDNCIIKTSRFYSNRRKFSFLRNGVTVLEAVGHIDRDCAISESQKYAVQTTEGDLFAITVNYAGSTPEDFNIGSMHSIMFGNIVAIPHTNFTIVFTVR